MLIMVRPAIFVLSLVILAVAPVHALTIIDSTPFEFENSYAASSGPDTVGGTFTTGTLDRRIAQFSLWVGIQGSLDPNPSSDLEAVILATSGGIPTGPALWSGTFTALFGIVSDHSWETG